MRLRAIIALVVTVGIGACGDPDDWASCFDCRSPIYAAEDLVSTGLDPAHSADHPSLDLMLLTNLGDPLEPGFGGFDPTAWAHRVSFSGNYLFPSPDVPCESSADCPVGFECLAAVTPLTRGEDPAHACGQAIRIEAESGLAWEAVPEGLVDIVLILELAETLAGIDSEGQFDSSCATDPAAEFVSAARSLVLRWERRVGDSADTQMCLVLEDAIPRFVPSAAECFSPPGDRIVRALGESTVRASGAPQTLNAIARVAEGAPWREGSSRHVILFTEGNGVSGTAQEEADAVRLAREVGLVVHVIHLDTAVPEYCAFATGGPDAATHRIAADTGGTYQYATTTASLHPAYVSLMGTILSRYTLDLSIGRDDGTPIPPGEYRVSTELALDYDGHVLTLPFVGDEVDPYSAMTVDNRWTLIVE